MAEETIIIRVGFPYLDERLYPAGWRSFYSEIIALNNYYIQSEVIGLNKISGELINDIISINDISPGVFNTIRSLNTLEMIQEIISLNSFPDPVQKEVISLNILAEEHYIDYISHNVLQDYNGPYTSEIKVLNRLEAVEDVAAQGTMTLTGLPNIGDTIVIDGTTFTFIAAGAVGDQINIGGTVEETIDNIIAVINASMTTVEASEGSGNTVIITAITPGTDGNSLEFIENVNNLTIDGSDTLGGTTFGEDGTIFFEEYTHSVNIFLDEKNITDNIEKWQITIDDESYVNSITIDFTDKSYFSDCDPLLNIGEKRIKLTLDDIDYEFLLERRNLSRDSKSGNFGIWGRSLIAILDVPYAIPITDKVVVEDGVGGWYCPDDSSYIPHIWQTQDRLASEIIENVIGESFNLVMEANDFMVKKKIFVVSNETPIEIVNKLASVIGAYVRTDFSDNIIVRYHKYNVTGSSQVTFTDLENIFLLNERISFPQGYNRILVRGPIDSLTDQSIGLEIILDAILNNDKTTFEFGDDIWVRVYKSPFSVEYSIGSSLGTVALINLDVQDLISRESSGFSGKTLQTDRPINSITLIERYDCSILSSSDYSFEQGYKIVTSESAIEDEPVLISYISKYNLYKLTVNQPCDPLAFDEVISRIVVEQT